MKYRSTKTYHQKFPVAYRQWRADRKSGKSDGELYSGDEIPGCNAIHGYALSIHLEFEADDLDARNWVVDFGGLRELKYRLEEMFDHTLLLAEDDPEFDTIMDLHNKGLAKVVVVEKTGCEALADFIYNFINGKGGYLEMLGYDDRVWCCRVEVRETDSNMAMRLGHREDGDID
jgi:6-pyruvoyltetrahydropterin/6-carboxytetrahydropterin synthase